MPGCMLDREGRCREEDCTDVFVKFRIVDSKVMMRFGFVRGCRLFVLLDKLQVTRNLPLSRKLYNFVTD